MEVVTIAVRVADKLQQFNGQTYFLMDSSAVEYIDKNGNSQSVKDILDNTSTDRGGSSEKQIKDWVSGSSYLEGDYIYHEGEIYRCLASNNDVDFDEANWEQLTYGIDELSKEDVERLLGLTEEELETMASLISDTEVRIDKTYSSSKIYTDIQQCLEDSKTYTLEEIAKLSGASYKIVASVSEMTSESIIYLLANGNTYDMYIVEENGATTKIGDMNIDLSNYYTKTEIDNGFLKKVNADGKYATITTVDGKVDKDKIVTVLDDTVTDEQIPTAKAVFNSISSISDVDNLTSLVAITNLNDFKGSSFMIGRGTGYNNETTNIPNGVNGAFVVEWFPYGNGDLYGVQKITLVQPINNKYVTFERSLDNNNWMGWQRVCTTTVADVPFTELTVNNWAKGSVVYTVKDGICYIWITGLESSTMDKNSQTIVSNLPVPKRGGLWCNIVSSDCTKGGLLVTVTPDGKLQNYSGLNNTTYFGTFSYPVAE